MLNSHAVRAIKNRRSIIFHDTMYAKDAFGSPRHVALVKKLEEELKALIKEHGEFSEKATFKKREIARLKAPQISAKDSDPRGYKVKDDGPIYIGNSGPLYKGDKVFNKKTGKKETIEYISSDQIGIGGKYYEPGSNMEAIFEVRDSDPRGYKVTDQIIKGFMVYKSGKPNIFTAKNESGEQYEGTMEQVKKQIDAYWVKRDEDVMKQKVRDELTLSEAIKIAKRELYPDKDYSTLNATEHDNVTIRARELMRTKTKDKVNDAIKIVSYKGYEIIKNDNDDKFRVFLSGFEVFVPQKSLEAAKALIDKKNSKAKDSKTKDGLTSEDKRQIQESIRRLESKRKEAIKAGKENYLNSEIARLKKALEEPTDFFMRDISDSKTKDKSPRWHIKDDKLFRLRSAVKKMKDADLLNEQDKRLINEQLERIKKHCPINSKWYIYKSGKLAVAITVIGYPKDLNGYGEDRVITNKGVFSTKKLIDPSFMPSFKERGGKVEDSDSQREILAKLAEKAGDIEYANDVRSGKVPYGQLAKRIAYYGLYSTGDAKNYMGERSFRTYEAWKRACKEINPSVVFEGNRDICQAKPGIGEWDGNEGIIYTKDGIAKYSKTKDNQQLVQIYKGVEIIFDDVQGVYWCKRKGATLALKDNDIGRLKKSLDFYLEGKGYDSKSTKDSVNGVINSIKNNPTIKKLLNPGKSNVYKNDNLYGVTPYGYLVRFSGGYLVFGPSGEYVKSLSSSMIQGELGTLVGEVSTFDSKTNDDVMYQGQLYPVKELHRILANKGKVKEFNELSEKEQKERMDNPFALYESGDNIYAVVRRNKVN